MPTLLSYNLVNAIEETQNLCHGSLNWDQRIVIYMPAILSLFLLLYFIRMFRKHGYMKNLFQEKKVDAALLQNSQEPPKSVSRVILFLSGITAISLSIGIVSYSFYYMICCSNELDLSNLANVLLALGIGVIPYSINKLA